MASFENSVKEMQEQAKAFAKRNEPPASYKKLVEGLKKEWERFEGIVKGYVDAETVKQFLKIAKQEQAAADRLMKPVRDMERRQKDNLEVKQRINQIIAEAGERFQQARRERVKKFVEQRVLEALKGMPVDEIAKRIEEEIVKAIKEVLG